MSSLVLGSPEMSRCGQNLATNQSSKPTTRRSTRERVLNVPASWEDKGRADLPLPSCAIAVHGISNPASPVCRCEAEEGVQMDELGESVVWREAAAQGSIKT